MSINFFEDLISEGQIDIYGISIISQDIPKTQFAVERPEKSAWYKKNGTEYTVKSHTNTSLELGGAYTINGYIDPALTQWGELKNMKVKTRGDDWAIFSNT